MQNGGNSPFALLLRLFGKKVFLSQDGVDWKRAKWPWYGRLYLWMTQYLTAIAPHAVIFDNIYCQAEFEKRFRRSYDFVPFGSEVDEQQLDVSILDELGLKPGEYFLFVGRFIPDKGLQYLIPAFEGLKTNKKLVLVGGAPNPSEFERTLMATKDSRIVFPGYVYGGRTHALMKNAYAYVQPSDIEGLSPVVLESMGLGTPIICSDIIENKYVVGDTGVLFSKSNTDDLRNKLQWSLENPQTMKANGVSARRRAHGQFSWEAVAKGFERIFLDWRGLRHKGGAAAVTRLAQREPASAPIASAAPIDSLATRRSVLAENVSNEH
jgi:glycosyltransferase involved in cell wall biosynthesis